MTEYINKADVWNERPEWRNEYIAGGLDAAYNEGWNKCNNEWLDNIQAMPTIDIVRCGECEFFYLNEDEFSDGTCELYSTMTDRDDFCSCGREQE